MIYILTDEIRTGKTTALLDWCENRNDVDGLLCPDGNDRKRYFLKMKSQKEIELEVEFESENTISIGTFNFLKSAFEEANEYLLDAKRSYFKYLIVDEIGKLELKNEGLHPSAELLIPQYMQNENFHLILVVRESLFDKVLKHYAISEYSILKKEDFNK